MNNLFFTVIYFLARFRFRKGEPIKQDLKKKSVGVLGNGPFMLSDLSINQDTSVDLYVSVNDAPNTEAFFKYRPQYHFLIDPFFFNINEKRVKSIVQGLDKADWPLKLVVPRHLLSVARSIYLEQDIIGIPLNEIKGRSKIEREIFKHRLGMPRAQNVLVSVLSFLLWNKVENINLFGVSHDWVKYMILVERSLHLKSHHYFDNMNDYNASRPWLDAKGRNYKVSEVLEKQSQMFKSYDWLAYYISKERIDTKIINYSKDTLIDSFDVLQKKE